ncbi:MAG: hypothetical protein JSU84_04375 [Thiotrichales bacterium]|nr:MAG: hypothetical protein JSU84_04375 [Thiotrichales bacterium]
MKSLVRCYVDPVIEDRIKVLSSSSGISVSAMAAELIGIGLVNKGDTALSSDRGLLPLMQEQLYLGNLLLRLNLSHGLTKAINDDDYANLRSQSQEWAAARVRQLSTVEV